MPSFIQGRESEGPLSSMQPIFKSQHRLIRIYRNQLLLLFFFLFSASQSFFIYFRLFVTVQLFFFYRLAISLQVLRLHIQMAFTHVFYPYLSLDIPGLLTLLSKATTSILLPHI